MKNSTQILLYIASAIAILFAFLKSGLGKVVLSPGSSSSSKVDTVLPTVFSTDVVSPPPVVSTSTVSVSTVPEPVLGTTVADVYTIRSTSALSSLSVVPDPSGAAVATDIRTSSKFLI